MAKNKESQNNNKFHDKKHIAWMITGGVIAAAAVAFGVLSAPIVGATALFTFGTSLLVSGAALALGVATMTISGAKHRKAKKLFKQSQRQREVVAEENVQAIEEREEHLKAEKLKEVDEVKEIRTEEQPAFKINLSQNDSPTLSEFKTDKIGPNTFAVYERDGKTLLTDEKGEKMIYSISPDNRFRYALNGLAKEFSSLSDCLIVVVDANGNEGNHKVSDRSYRNDMMSVYNDIKTVRSNLAEKESIVELN